MVLEERPYQKECIDIINNLDSGSYLVVMATGLGKTTIFSRIERKGRILILSHREELVHQPEKYYDCPFGVERAKETSNGEEVISASVQTLIHRLDKFAPDEFDTIITDEAHHAVAPSYRKIYDYFHPRLHVGFTATPNRGDKVGLKAIYSSIVYKKDIRWGIKNNYLSDVDCNIVDIGCDLRKVKKRMGDFETKDLERVINQQKINEGVAAVYERMAKGQTIIFAASVSHARNIAGYIEGAEVITANTPDRAEILEKFKRKEIRCIINCMVLTEGTDLPMIETIIIARPTMNPSLYTQMVGRGLRKYEGKEYLTLIDCVGNTGKVNICTAPTLFGLDPSLISEKKRSQLKGKLTEMPKLMQKLMDNPEGWIMNKRNIDLFSSENNVNVKRINFIIHSDDSLSCSVGNRTEIYITAPDEIGNSKVYCISGNRAQLLRKDCPLQEAVDFVERELRTNYRDSEKLWDLEKVQTWGYQLASKKQLDLIKELLSSEKNKMKYGDEPFDTKNLSRYHASLIIGHILSDQRKDYCH